MKTLLLHLFLLLMHSNKRELFIFYNQDGVTIKDKQLIELQKDKTGMEERDIIIYSFQTNAAKDKAKKYLIDTSKTFTIILIGKDGGEKLRLDSVLTTTKLFATIDAMPMRKSEMKNN